MLASVQFDCYLVTLWAKGQILDLEFKNTPFLLDLCQDQGHNWPVLKSVNDPLSRTH